MTKEETVIGALKGEGYLGESRADEPVFVLCARDPLAAGVVRLWAYRRSMTRLGVDEKCLDAIRVAEAMENWQIRLKEESRDAH